MSDPRSFHEYVDESIRKGSYRLTAVRVRSRDVSTVTRQIRERIPVGQLRVHMSSESDRRRRQILRAFVGLDIAATVYETPYSGRGSDQEARERCLGGLLDDLEPDGVANLVLDSRGQARDFQDRRFIRDGLIHLGTESLAYTHRGSRDEPLLALPDAIGWAVGAGKPWRAMVSEVIRVRRIREMG